MNIHIGWDQGLGCSNYKSMIRSLPLSQRSQGRLVSIASSAWAGMQSRRAAPNSPAQPSCYSAISELPEDNLQRNSTARLELTSLNAETPTPLPPSPADMLPSSLFSCLPVHPHYRRTYFAPGSEHWNTPVYMGTHVPTTAYAYVLALREYLLFFFFSFPAEITWLLKSHWTFFIHFSFAAAGA